jgi:predicted molibdopterin-dependent oxidoreductase YjgC
MVVRTNTPRVEQAVRYAMEFLLLHHPIDCPVCDQSGECWLQDYYMEHAMHDSRYPGTQKTQRSKAVDLGPLVKLDRERCILCTRCVRFTRNVTHTNEIMVFNRGHASEIAIHDGKSFDNPYSANVADICPVGALTNSDFRFKVRSWFLKGTDSVCGGCSTGCNLRIDHSARALGGGIPGKTATEGTIYRTLGRRNVEVNRSWLCDEGRLSFHTMERWPRLKTARTAEGDPQPVASLMAAIHRRFEQVRGDHGSTAVAALGSAVNTNEALFLLKKYFQSRVDFRLGQEVENYQKRQDDLLRRVDKHPNTQGALDLGLGSLGGLRHLRSEAERKQIRAMWIAFHPQLVGEDEAGIAADLDGLIRALRTGQRASSDGGLGRGNGHVHELCRPNSDYQPRRRPGRRLAGTAHHDGAPAGSDGSRGDPGPRRHLRMAGPGYARLCGVELLPGGTAWRSAGGTCRAEGKGKRGRTMTPFKGGYAVDVPVINVSEKARLENERHGVVDLQGIRRDASPVVHEPG